MRAALRSSFDSSVSPADSGMVSRSSSSSTSPLRSGGVPVGIRKPATYQFEGRSRPGNCSAPSTCPPQGPTRSSFRASTRTRADLHGVGRSTISGGHGRRVPYNGVGSRWSELCGAALWMGQSAAGRRRVNSDDLTTQRTGDCHARRSGLSVAARPRSRGNSAPGMARVSTCQGDSGRRAQQYHPPCAGPDPGCSRRLSIARALQPLSKRWRRRPAGRHVGAGAPARTARRRRGATRLRATLAANGPPGRNLPATTSGETASGPLRPSRRQRPPAAGGGWRPRSAA